jgi:hypothetical protein
MLPDSELAATTGAAPGPELQRAVMSAGQYVQHQYEGTVDPDRLMRAADIVLANGVKHLDAHRAVVTSSGKLYKTENGACPCSDSTHRSVICKHVLATAISRQVNILMAPEPEDVGDAKDSILNSFMPLGSWREREPAIVHSIKWRDNDGHEHLHIVRGDDLDEVLLHLRTVKAVIAAARARETRDDVDDLPEPPVPTKPAMGETPSCRRVRRKQGAGHPGSLEQDAPNSVDAQGRQSYRVHFPKQADSPFAQLGSWVEK